MFSISCLLLEAETQLNDFGTDNENCETPKISVPPRPLILFVSEACPPEVALKKIVPKIFRTIYVNWNEKKNNNWLLASLELLSYQQMFVGCLCKWHIQKSHFGATGATSLISTNTWQLWFDYLKVNCFLCLEWIVMWDNPFHYHFRMFDIALLWRVFWYGSVWICQLRGRRRRASTVLLVLLNCQTEHSDASWQLFSVSSNLPLLHRVT